MCVSGYGGPIHLPSGCCASRPSYNTLNGLAGEGLNGDSMGGHASHGGRHSSKQGGLQYGVRMSLQKWRSEVARRAADRQEEAETLEQACREMELLRMKYENMKAQVERLLEERKRMVLDRNMLLLHLAEFSKKTFKMVADYQATCETYPGPSDILSRRFAPFPAQGQRRKRALTGRAEARSVTRERAPGQEAPGWCEPKGQHLGEARPGEARRMEARRRKARQVDVGRPGDALTAEHNYIPSQGSLCA